MLPRAVLLRCVGLVFGRYFVAHERLNIRLLLDKVYRALLYERPVKLIEKPLEYEDRGTY